MPVTSTKLAEAVDVVSVLAVETTCPIFPLSVTVAHAGFAPVPCVLRKSPLVPKPNLAGAPLAP